MDVTPQLIEQIEFSEKFRGYDPDQVDDFLERVGAALSESRARADELARRVEELERQLQEAPSAPAPVAEPVAPMSDDEEIEQATRTLMLAKRTAEAAISEARAEANQLLADARSKADASTRDAATEAERLVRDAQLQREELLRRAKEDAEGEFAGQREQHQSEIARLAEERRTMAGQVQAMESRLDEHRGRLDSTVKALQELLDDPSRLGALPSLDLDTSAIAAGGGVGTGVDPSTIDTTSGTARSPFYSTGTVAAVRVPEDAVSVVEDVPEGAGGDPWGPGSWAEVANGVDQPQDDEPSLFDRGEEGGRAEQDPGEPTQAYNAIDRDDAEDGADEAMTAFFEGEEPATGRRFGRRR
jgi:DivIVA domain-containing protein